MYKFRLFFLIFSFLLVSLTVTANSVVDEPTKWELSQWDENYKTDSSSSQTSLEYEDNFDFDDDLTLAQAFTESKSFIKYSFKHYSWSYGHPFLKEIQRPPRRA